jgi:DNA-binding protein HU-beta
MIDVSSRLKDVTDRGKWSARGASFMTKLKATKAVWFPPEPVDSGAKGASTAKKATTKAAKKSAGTTKKAGKTTAKKTTSKAKKSTAAAKKTTGT